jgi:two-component system, NarL family, nitrate/nitrite response regulator NarL
MSDDGRLDRRRLGAVTSHPSASPGAGSSATNGRAAPVRVLVADDHPLYREAVTRVLAESPDVEVVAETGDLQEAEQAVARLEPDVALVGLKMSADAQRLVRRIQTSGSPTRVLFLSAHTGSEEILEALAAGASGYVGKDSSGDAITEAVLAVSRGDGALSPKSQAVLLSELRSRWDDSHVLSDREREILAMAAEGLSNPDIGARLFISPETVKTHLRKSYGKLGVSDRTAAVAHAIRRGLIE